MHRALRTERENVIPDRKELKRASGRLEGRPPWEVVRWAAETYGEGLALSVSFGNMEGLILLDMLSRITNRARVFTLDTGFLFRETVRFRKEVMEQHSLPLEVVEPELSIEEQVARYGEELRGCNPDLCCHIRKVEPQQRFLRGYSAWMTGIRRDQTPQRRGIQIVDWDEYFGVVKISPLAAWSAERVHEYARENGIPANPLLSRGYKSIGCAPQTRPVPDGEDARSGRWADSDKTECGIHIVNGKVESADS